MLVLQQVFSLTRSATTPAQEVHIYLSLFKLRVVGLLTFTAMVAAMVAAGGALPLRTLTLLILAGGIAAAGSAALNHYLDRDLDALMTRTKSRPLPSGRIAKPQRVLWLGIILIALSLPISAALNYSVSLYTLLGAFIYVVVYTLWLKRRTPLNIVIGGLAGSCAVLAGWSAIGEALSVVSLLIASLVFLWTPGHFWSLALARREDYLQAGVPMLPAMSSGRGVACFMLFSNALLVLFSLLLYRMGGLGQLYFVVALLGGGLLLVEGLRLLADPSPRLAWRGHKVSGLYLLSLFAAILIQLFL